MAKAKTTKATAKPAAKATAKPAAKAAAKPAAKATAKPAAKAAAKPAAKTTAKPAAKPSKARQAPVTPMAPPAPVTEAIAPSAGVSRRRGGPAKPRATEPVSPPQPELPFDLGDLDS
jgi:hypothetical protein